MSSETADSSSTLGEMFWGEKQSPHQSISHLNQTINYTADFKSRCPTMGNGANLMTIQSMTCWLVQDTLTCKVPLRSCLWHINNSITIVTVVNVCHHFSWTVCSHDPTGHVHFPSFQLLRHCIILWYQGTIFLWWRYDRTAPPSGHRQPNLDRFPGEQLLLCAVQGRICLC